MGLAYQAVPTPRSLSSHHPINVLKNSLCCISPPSGTRHQAILQTRSKVPLSLPRPRRWPQSRDSVSDSDPEAVLSCSAAGTDTICQIRDSGTRQDSRQAAHYCIPVIIRVSDRPAQWHCCSCDSWYNRPAAGSGQVLLCLVSHCVATGRLPISWV